MTLGSFAPTAPMQFNSYVVERYFVPGKYTVLGRLVLGCQGRTPAKFMNALVAIV